MRSIIVVMMTTGIVVGQQRLSGQVKVLTVCEALGNANLYADAAVAVVGRMERSVSLTDHYEFLSQDRCEHPIVTNGHVWPGKIQIWTTWEEGMPRPPSERPKLERPAIALKVSMVRKTTKLGSHREPQFQADGRSIGSAKVPNAWAIVYGRIVRVPNLNEDCGAGGCGGDDVPLVIIAEPYNVHGLGRDGTLLPEER